MDTLPSLFIEKTTEMIRGLPDFYKEHTNMAEYKEEFEKLGLGEKHIWEFYKVFRQIDKDNSLTITVDELLGHLRTEETPFARRIFSIFDEDGNNNIDFREFVITMWNYCTLAKNALIMFAFDLYDFDSSGKIDIREIKLMLEEIYGSSFENNRHAMKVMEKIKLLNEGRTCSDSDITLDQFRQFVATHQSLLWPAFVMQEHLRRMVCGRRFWNKRSKYRFKMTPQANLKIDHVLLAHMNEEKFKELVENMTEERYEESLKKQTTMKGLKTALDIVGVTGILNKRRREAQAKGNTKQETIPTSNNPLKLTTDQEILKLYEDPQPPKIYARFHKEGKSLPPAIRHFSPTAHSIEVKNPDWGKDVNNVAPSAGVGLPTVHKVMPERKDRAYRSHQKATQKRDQRSNLAYPASRYAHSAQTESQHRKVQHTRK